MNANDEKEVEVDRLEIIYNEQRNKDLQDRYGKATEIKRHVKTSATIYEIRTSLRYWNGSRATHLTCDCTWYRLESFEKHGLTEEEANRL